MSCQVNFPLQDIVLLLRDKISPEIIGAVPEEKLEEEVLLFIQPKIDELQEQLTKLPPEVHVVAQVLQGSVLETTMNNGDVFTIDLSPLFAKFDGLLSLYDKNVEAGAGANGWTDLLIETSENVNQRQINDGLESVSQLAGVKNPRNGMRVYIKSYHAGLNKGGGTFVYDATKANINDGGNVINGWVRQVNAAHTDVTNFGAKGDGVTDDTNAIEAAKLVGVNTFFPKGVYIITRGIRPISNTKVFGNGDAVIKWKDGYNGDNTDWSYKSLIFINGNTSAIENVEITGLILDANRENVTNTQHCIRVGGALVKNITISNNTMLNAEIDSVYTQFASQVNIRHNYAFNAGRSHFVITNGKSILIEGNQAKRAQNSYIDIESNYTTDVVEGVTITNNIFVADSACSADGIGCTGIGSQDSIIIDNNIFLLNSRLGGMGGINGIVISNNFVRAITINDTNYILEALGASKNIVIRGNTIIVDSTSSYAIGTIRLRAATNFDISGNYIYGSKGISINVDAGSGSTQYGSIKNNKMFDCATGITSTASYSQIEGNKIVRSASTAIYSSGVGSSVSNNIIDTTSSNHGIQFANKQNITGNIIKNTGSRGIYSLSASGSTISGNTIEFAGSAGVEIRNSKDVLISINIITGCLSNGITTATDTSQITIESNILKNNTGRGIVVAGTRFTVSNNRAYDDQAIKTQLNGLQLLSGVDYVYIGGNDFSGNSTSGISGTVVNYLPKVGEAIFSESMSAFNFL